MADKGDTVLLPREGKEGGSLIAVVDIRSKDSFAYRSEQFRGSPEGGSRSAIHQDGLARTTKRPSFSEKESENYMANAFSCTHQSSSELVALSTNLGGAQELPSGRPTTTPASSSTNQSGVTRSGQQNKAT